MSLWGTGSNMELIILIVALSVLMWALIVNCNAARDQQWRDWLHGDGSDEDGWIAPDGKDFHGEKVTRK